MATDASIPSNSMDRVRQRSAWWRWRHVLGAAALLLLGGLGAAGWVVQALSVRDAQRVEAARITVAAVVRARFEDYVPIRASAEPARTVFLDAVEGGRVDRVLVQEGARVQQGQLLAELSNVGLQLDLISREAQVTEQLNAMRALELSLQDSRLARENTRAEIEYRLAQQRRDLQQQESLAAAGFVSVGALTRLREDLGFQAERQRLARESEAVAGRLQAEQLQQLRTSARQLQANLSLARQNLQALTVRAPMAGTLSAFDLQPGQSLARGARLGQIDEAGAFKLSAGLDQFYLGRVTVGQTAEVALDEAMLSARVSRILPQVNAGEFRIELEFAQPPRQELRRGQTLQARLTLGVAGEVLVLPNAAFLQDNGGAQVFVLAADGASASRRAVRLGRRNPQWVEVLDGLHEGEQVVVSATSGYATRERLLIRR